MMTSNAFSTSSMPKLRAILAVLAVVVLCFTASAQEDTTTVAPQPQVGDQIEIETRRGTIEGKKVGKTDGENYPMERRSPRKASLYSAILPGLGQAYNKKYWKIPILYGGFALTGYYLRDNLRNIDFYRNAIIADINGDVNSPDYTGLPRDFLDASLEQYLQWRDLSYIVFGIIYILNIVDANVDAHLFYFDVSEDISMNVKPYWSPFMPTMPGLTFTLKL